MKGFDVVIAFVKYRMNIHSNDITPSNMRSHIRYVGLCISVCLNVLMEHITHTMVFQIVLATD